MFEDKPKSQDKESAGSAEERIAALFQPDTLLNDQFLDTYRRHLPLEPEQRLVIAVLEDGIHAFQDNFGASHSKKRRIFDDAETWIFSDDNDWIFSFVSVCSLLNLEPAYLRRGLRQWQTRQRPGAQTEPVRLTSGTRRRAA
jgi:hypothetical protein